MKIYLLNNDNWQLYDDEICDLDAELNKRGLILSKEAKIHAPFYFAGGEIRGGVIWGGEIRGGVIRDGVIRGGVIWDGVIWGGEIMGGVIWDGIIIGGEIRGGVIRGGEIRGGVIWGGEISETPLLITGSKHFVLWNKSTMTVSIGCKELTVDEWFMQGEEIADNNHFTENEKLEYRQYLLMIKNMIDAKKENINE